MNWGLGTGDGLGMELLISQSPSSGEEEAVPVSASRHVPSPACFPCLQGGLAYLTKYIYIRRAFAFLSCKDRQGRLVLGLSFENENETTLWHGMRFLRRLCEEKKNRQKGRAEASPRLTNWLWHTCSTCCIFLYYLQIFVCVMLLPTPPLTSRHTLRLHFCLLIVACAWKTTSISLYSLSPSKLFHENNSVSYCGSMWGEGAHGKISLSIFATFSFSSFSLPT